MLVVIAGDTCFWPLFFRRVVSRMVANRCRVEFWRFSLQVVQTGNVV